MVNQPASRRAAFIAQLPKAELHLHIEGTLEPEMLFEFAARNGVAIPFATAAEVRNAYEFSNLQDFLDIYYQGMAVLLQEEDFYELTFAYLERAHADCVRHVEIFFDPQGHTERGVEFATVISGILRALDAGQRRFGITHRLIMCFLRHLDESAAFDTLVRAEPWLDRIAGIGLDSSELGHPPGKFARVFAAARAKGLKLVAHAGEEGPPAYVAEALDLLRVDRIDHGNRALEDPALVDRIVDDGLTLTVCPLSNLKLGVTKTVADSPIRAMLASDVRATINSDDPAYFGGYINANYEAVAEALDLDLAELATLAANSFAGSFLPQTEKDARIAEIEAIAARFRGRDDWTAAKA